MSILHSKGFQPTLHNVDRGFTVLGNVRNGTASIGINVLDGEIMMSTYQDCSKTSQRNTTMYGMVRSATVVQRAAWLKAVQKVHMEAHLYALSTIQGCSKGVVQSLDAPRQRVQAVKAAQIVV